jgi:DNA-binding response OmpR family regulator/DNA-binding HxlR family transcriptional regulator
MGRMQAATEVLTYKWHPDIVYTIHELEGAGYSELEAALDGISSKMLSGGLSDLRERGILETRETVEGSGRKTYVLSDRGRALVPALEMLDAWNRRYERGRSSVLILEDERMVADIFTEYFAESYDVQHVRTGEEAIETYTDDIDLLIVDRKLEGMSGDDVAARIRAEHEQPLILCVSGVEPDDDICELAVDDYIHKPVEEAEMKTRLELLLDRAALDATARTYLSLRSKQIALTDTHGKAATKMDGYRSCAARIEELDLSAGQRETLEPLCPSAPHDSPPVGD